MPSREMYWCGRCETAVPTSDEAWRVHCAEYHPELTVDASVGGEAD